MKNNRITLILFACLSFIISSFNVLAAPTTPQPKQQANIHYISTGNLDCILIEIKTIDNVYLTNSM